MSTDPIEASNIAHLDVEWRREEATVWCNLVPVHGPASICPLLSEVIGPGHLAGHHGPHREQLSSGHILWCLPRRCGFSISAATWGSSGS